MPTVSTLRSLAASEEPKAPIGIAKLAKLAFDGLNLSPIWMALVERVNRNPEDAAAFLDLSTIARIQGRQRDSDVLQSHALELRRVYHHAAPTPAVDNVRLLVFKAPGDFMANLPIEFMLEGAAIAADFVYVLPGTALPDRLPEHDVALVAIAESDDNQILLRELASALRYWKCPVINRPERIARLSRDGTWELLKDAPGVAMPGNFRIERARLVAAAAGNENDNRDGLEGIAYPIVARPIASHAGNGLQKLEGATDLTNYLKVQPESEFFISPFVDYRSADGQFRKYRIVIVGGRAYACHMAVSDNWMVHYLNADMRANIERRAEERRFMETFDAEFSMTHAEALAAIAERARLDYLPIDCGEAKDGKLLIFESGTNMIVHSMDPVELFPYKPVQMQKIFDAFGVMVRRFAGSGLEARRVISVRSR